MFDIEKVKNVFKTEPNKAYFWSGLGADGAEIAANTAKQNGGTTLEMLMEENKNALIDAGFPYDDDMGAFFWNPSDVENKVGNRDR